MTDEITERRLSRRQILGMAAAGAAAIGMTALPTGAQADSISYQYYPLIPSGTYTPESATEIVSNMLTQEYLHATVSIGLVLDPTLSARFGTNKGLPQAHFQSLVAIHQDRIDFWTGQFPAATPITSFTVDPSILAGPAGLFPAGEAVDSLRIATGIAALREFAELGQPTLSKWVGQQVAMDGGIYTALRFLEILGGGTSAIPPVNKAFATDLVLYTRDAIAVLRALGIIGGSGVPLSYPGRDVALAAAGPMMAAVRQARPNNATTTVEVHSLADLTNPRP